MRILSLYLKKLPTAVQKGFGGVKKDAIGMDTSSFIMDMPLPNRLHDFESYLPSSPEDLVEKMLADIYHGN